MDNYKRIDKLIMKYLIIGAIVILLITNYKQVLQWLSVLMTVLQPIIMGAGIAYIINLLMVQFEKIYFPNKHAKWVIMTRRPVSILSSFIVVLFIIVFVISLIAPQLISVFATMIEKAPELFTMVENWILQYNDLFPQLADFVQDVDIDWQGFASQFLNMINNFTGNVIETTVSTIGSVFNFIVNIFLAIIISIYILLTKEKLAGQFKRVSNAFLPERLDQNLRYLLSVLNESFSSFFVGETIEAVILGSMVALGMWIFRFPYAGMIGALTGVTAYIPFVGAYISASVGFLLILVESPIRALLFLVLIIVIQQIEGNIIYPRVVGQSIGLSGLWVIVGITIGGGLWGVPGMLFGVPISSAIYRLIKDNVVLKEKYKGRLKVKG
ncbi:MAG: AI-2E family transporter [Amphibacillus sp.]|nr:AI-2E family transporter [Amphibacillus sp.]